MSDKEAVAAQPVVMDVVLAAAALPALLAELRQAGVAAVNAPDPAEQARPAYKAGGASAPGAAPPATNIHVRLVFLPTKP